MSSCQDSMDTEDSIPRPEYEDILPDEDGDDEVDDDDIDEDGYWAEKSKLIRSMENGNTQETTSTMQTNNSTETPMPSSTSSSTQSQPSEETTADEEMIEGSYDEEEEISYDEADENFDRDDVDEESLKTSEKLEETPQQQPEESKDEPANAEILTRDLSTSETQTDSTNNLVLVTVVNENGKLLLPIQRAGEQLIAMAKDKDTSPLDESKATHLEVRSSTPSCRASREFIALQKSFTESKVLSEFVNEKDRQRKSRKTALKSEDSTGDVSEREKFTVYRGRSKSCTRAPIRPGSVPISSSPQKWPSDEKLNCKRENMRSQNTDFVQKQMKFLNRVKHDQTGDEMSEMSESEQSLNESNKTICLLESKDDCWQPPPKKGADSFCWKCRKCADLIACSKCPRSYHYRCIKVSTQTRLDRTWICPECINLENCINGTKKMKKESLSIDMLNQLLLFALKRMKQIKGHEKLLNVPDENECPLYSQYVVNPVTLNSIQDKIEKKAFRCTEEFVLETKWIQHNVSIAYAAYGTKDGLLAKTLLKICRQEAAEIETCPECYLNANTHKDWFVDVCLKPHILLWAKLKGFPYWPAKGMGLGPNSLVNVRFFGDHDRAFVPVKDCYLYSEVDPNPNSGKRAFRPGIADCIKEVDVHIEKIKAKVGAFQFALPKTPYDPSKETSQLEEMMPGVTEYVKRQQALQKPPLTYKIVKTADNNLSIIKKPDSGTESDHSMGAAEKIKNNVVAAAESPKLSPLSEEPKPKEEQTSSSPKHASSSKNMPSKAMSLNYEVVAKPPSKDEANSSKINSVILKRKSDIVATPPNVKKSKSSEDIPVKECSNASTSMSPKHEEPVDPPPVQPAKRIRGNDSEEKPSSSPGPRVPLSFRVEPQVQNIQKAVVVQKPPKPQPQPQTQPQAQPVPKQPAPETRPSEPSSLAMAKLVQNRQGVTIKKLTKKQPSTGTGFHAEENGPNSTSTRQQTVNKYVDHFTKPATTVSLPKPIPLPGPPPKQVQIVPKPQQTPAKSPPSSTPSAPKPRPKSPLMPTTSIIKMVPKPPFEPERARDQSKVFPRVEIKVEKTDDDEQSYVRTAPMNINSLTMVNAVGARAPLFPTTSTKATNTNPPPIPVNPELIKKEHVSDDDSQNSAHSAPSQDNASGNRLPEDLRLVDSSGRRIVVRSLESLSMHPPLTNTPLFYTAAPSASAPASAAPVQPKRGNARARKSFPNRGPPVSAVHLPPEVNPPLLEPSMVYIPVDSQNNIVPILPLTAVSKQIGPSTALVSLSLTGNFCETTPASTQTSSQTPTPPASAAPPPAATPPAPSQPASSSVTATPPAPPAAAPPPPVSRASSSNSGTPTTSGNSSTQRQSYVASLKTLSPLQLTEPATSNATPSGSRDKGNREPDGHILSGIVTPRLASAVTETIVRGPPRLTPRPNGALRSDGSRGRSSDGGPFSRALMDNAHKMTDFFISVMQDTISDMSNADILPAKIVELQLELEAKTAAYEKRLSELKHNTDTMLCEMKKNMELERARVIAETRKQCEIERIRAVEYAKKKQWCSNCGREANHYCCWNTAYCDTTCQSMDWLRHKPNCGQVNQHLNSELQGPGVLHSAPTVTTAAPTPTTQSSQSAGSTATAVPTQSSGAGPSNHVFRPPAAPAAPAAPAVTSASTSAPIPIPTVSATTSVAQAPRIGTNQQFPQPPVMPNPSVDATYRPREILKLPPATFLRAVPTLRLPATPPVHRFNIPLPIGAATSAGGPPYTLVQREGNWELMGTPPQQVPMTVAPTTTSFQQAPRMVSPATPNPPHEMRPLGPGAIRPGLL